MCIDVTFSPDGRLMASGDVNGVVVLWNAAKLLAAAAAGKPPNEEWDLDSVVLATLTGHSAQVLDLAFSPDSHILASASSDNSIILWDVAQVSSQVQPLGPPLIGHENWVTALAFSPDGRTLVSGSSDSTLIFWDVASGQPLGPPLTGHTAQVWSVLFNPADGGQSLLSGGGDGTIIAWDVGDLSWPLQPLDPPFRGGVETEMMALGPDGRTVAMGNYSGLSVVLWNLDLEDWPARACSIANRNLTQDEWEEFLGSAIPYEPVCPLLPLEQ